MTPQQMARRGMASLIFAMAGFAALQVLFCIAVDVVEPGLREPEYGRKLAFLQAQVRQAPQRPRLLLLGSSRTAYGIRPDALFETPSSPAPLVYNFGILGGGPLYELLYFHRLLDAGLRPDWLLIEVHPALLKSVPELRAAHMPPLDRCDARDLCILHDYLDDPWAAWREWLHYRAAACFRFRGELLRRAAPRWLPETAQTDLAALEKTTPLGWVPGPWPKPAPAVRQARANLVRSFYSSGYKDFEVSDAPDRALRELLEVCRREKIGAALLLMPESEELRDAGVRRAQQEIGRYLARLGSEYGAEVFDAGDWCQEADFADGQHLLADAAARLSARLGGQALGGWLEAHVPASQPGRGGTSAAAVAGAEPRPLRR